jgi:Leucine-rich repeat (LRR) protein
MLRHLNLNHNELKQIQNLNLPHMTSLSIAHNMLESSSGLREMPFLQSLNLAYNHIVRMSRLG